MTNTSPINLMNSSSNLLRKILNCLWQLWIDCYVKLSKNSLYLVSIESSEQDYVGLFSMSLFSPTMIPGGSFICLDEVCCKMCNYIEPYCGIVFAFQYMSIQSSTVSIFLFIFIQKALFRNKMFALNLML